MTKKLTLFLLATTLLMLILSACTGSNLQASGWPGISADDETAYIAFNTQVYAIDLATGTERWHFPKEAEKETTFYAAPQITEDGQVIVGGYNNVLYSLDAQTGEQNWIFEDASDRYIGSVLIAEDVIFAPSADKHLYAVGLDGKALWDIPFSAENENWAQPATGPDCDCIYLASMDHSVYAINPEKGDIRWRSEPLGGASVGSPAVSDDGKTLYIGSFLNELVAIDAADASIIWKIPTEDWVWASPVIEGDTLYFADIAGNFYAIDRNTQKQLWTLSTGSDIVGTPLLTEDGLYFTTQDGTFYAVTREGATRWTKEFEQPLHAGPVAAGDLILIATDKGDLTLYAFDANGAQQWQFTATKEK